MLCLAAASAALVNTPRPLAPTTFPRGASPPMMISEPDAKAEWLAKQNSAAPTALPTGAPQQDVLPPEPAGRMMGTGVESLVARVDDLERRLWEAKQSNSGGGLTAAATVEMAKTFSLAAKNEELFRENMELNNALMNARRARIVLPAVLLSAALGSKTMMAEWLSEDLRQGLRMPNRPAEAAMNRFFPGARSTYEVDLKVFEALSRRGFTQENTLFATSACPDEVNFAESEITELMKTRWGESFALGGLAGMPFVGSTGFSAYAHHAPEMGKLLIMFAPHVGVDDGGKVGALHREYQAGASGACGAVLGSLGKVDAGMSNEEVRNQNEELMMSTYTDAQLAQIVNELARVMPSKSETSAPGTDRVARATFETYGLIRKYFVEQLLGAPGLWDHADELAVLGGIMINRASGGDRFMPLLFETRNRQVGSTQDLFSETFGSERPLLTASVGTKKRSDFMHQPVSLTRLDKSETPGALGSLMTLEEENRINKASGLR